MKVSNEGQELILLIIMAWFLFQCVFTNNVEEKGHQVLQKIGVYQKIEQFESDYNR